MKYPYISFVVIILLFFLRFYSTRPVYKSGDFVRITSKVYNEPIVYDREQYIKLQGLKFYLPKYPEISYGDTVVVIGQVSQDKLVSPKLVEIQDRGHMIYDLRQKLINFYKSSLPEPYASLVAGTVIGSKNMPESFWNRLKATGTAHVVVASGTNVTMTASFLIGLLTVFLKRRVAIWITLVGILGYVVISGFDAPIIRAGIMGSILLFSQEIGRVANTWRILIYSALIMLLIKPIWITDLGFILSFVATISLMLLQKKIDNRLKIIPAIFREGLSTSLAAQVGVAPIIFVTFGQFNILSPIINALILWTIPYIMVVGALGGIVGLIVPVLGRLILYVAFPFLLWFTKILEIFSF
jgi:competence protein ComEC